MYQSPDQDGRASSLCKQGRGFAAEITKRLGLTAILALLTSTASAAIQTGQVIIPPSIGMSMEANVSIQWVRVPGAGDDVVRIEVPAVPGNTGGDLNFLPTPGCTQSGRYLDCNVSGSSGQLTIKVSGAKTGGFSIIAGGRNSATTFQSQSSNVYSSGDVTIAKTLAVPAAGNPLSGELMRFDLKLNIADGGMDLPAGGTLTVTDTLPGNASNGFLISNGINAIAFTGSVPAAQRSCNTVTAANSTRTLECTFVGPLTIAQIRSATIQVQGTNRSSGNFINTAMIGASGEYIELNPNNITSSVTYNVDASSDLTIRATSDTALGTSNAPMGGKSTRTFSLLPINNGPLTMPDGAVVKTVLPPDWDLASLPAYCSSAPGSLTLDASNAGAGYHNGNNPTTGGQHNQTQMGTFTGTLVTCTLPQAAQGNWPSIPLTVTLPDPPDTISGYIPMLVEAPASGAITRDWAPTNNGTTLRWHLAPEAADLQMWKTKAPNLLEPGGIRTTTLNVYNAGPSLAKYDENTSPLRVIDWLDPREIDISDLSTALIDPDAAWNCTVSTNSPDPDSPSRSVRVECVRKGSGEIAVGGSVALSFKHKVTSNTADLNGITAGLQNRACTGSEALRLWSTGGATGPIPADPAAPANKLVTTGNDAQNRGDCHTVSGTVTSIITGKAQIGLQKEVAVSDAAGNMGSFRLARAKPGAPVLAAEANAIRWRMTITTPSGGSQETIPTLELRDTFGNLANFIGAAPNYQTSGPVARRISVTGANTIPDNCPATLARQGTSANSVEMLCRFTDVAPGTTIEVVYEVARPFAQATDGYLTNIAALSSPDAILTSAPGNAATDDGSRVFRDTAYAQVTPRADVEMSSKSIVTNPGNGTSTGGQPLARVGEVVTFNLSARNNGIDTIAAGNFVITDLLPGVDTATTPGYADVVATAGNSAAMDCKTSTVGTDTLVRCENLTPITLYQTQSVQVKARIIRPVTYPAGNNALVYSGVVNKATVSLLNMCEFRSQANTGVGGGHASGDSESCGDAESLANNDKSVTFDVALPSFDLQQTKLRLQGNENDPPILAGQPLKYRFGIYNRGPSRSQGVEMIDVLKMPEGGFDVVLVGTPQEVNSVNMYGGSTLARRLDSSISCSIKPNPAGTPNTLKMVSCLLGGTSAQSYLDGGESVSFVLEFRPVPPAGNNWGDYANAMTFSNTAFVCGDETNSYESDGKCLHDRPGFPNLPQSDLVTVSNNRAGVSNTVMPVTDLEVVSKTASVNKVDVGQVVPWILVLRNNGASAATAMRVIDTLPAGFEWVSTTAPTVANPTGNAVLSASGGNLTVATGVPSPDASDVCYISNGVTTVTASQQQQITCHVNGNFPVSSGYSLTLHARAKPGVYAGSWSPIEVKNHAAIEPGRDNGNNPLAVDNDPTNNDKEGPIQVVNASISGRVFLDQNNNGDQNGTGAGQDRGLAGVGIRLTGTDIYGNAVDITATTNADGDYRFDGLVPSNASGYTLHQDQSTVVPNTLSNGVPQPNTARTERNENSINVTNKGTASIGTDGGLISGIVLGSGGQGVQFDFPEVTLYSLSGYVFVDKNSSNTYNPGPGGDLPIPGATLELLVLANGNYVPVPGANGAANTTVTTDATGFYKFVGLDSALTYAVRQPLPTGYMNRPSAVASGSNCAPAPGCTVVGGQAGTQGNTTDEIRGIHLNGNGENYNFGEQEGAEIHGKVFLDYDNNGIQNGNDAGIGGQTIELHDANGTLVATTTTANDGTFSFVDLMHGTYTLHQPNQPPGTANGITTQGNIAGTPMGVATGVNVLPSQISSITLTAGQKSGDNLFAEIPTRGTVAGKVWMDNNDNGVIDGGEIGIADATIILTGVDINGNPISLTTTTGADGSYLFTDLPAGSYRLTQPDQPAQTLSGQTVPGTIGGAPMPGATATGKETTPSVINNIVLGENQHSVQNNFGELPMNASIAGRVWLDSNNDGVIDPIEVGIAGVTVRLTGTDHQGNPVARETQTDAEGRYLFDRLPPGSYTVTEPEQPAGTLSGKTVVGTRGGIATDPSVTPSVINGIVLGINQSSRENNFGEIPPGSIAGRVYYDDNDDGVVNAGEVGIPGQEIVLEGVDDLGKPVRLTTVTDGEGRYNFPNLRPGRYSVTQPNQPAQTDSGKTTAGSAGGVATPKETTPSAISGIELPSGVNSVDNNFGEINTNTPDLRVSKSVTPTVLLTGSTATYHVVVRNAGRGETHGEYEVVDRLPAGVALANTPSGEGWTCTGAAGESRFVCRNSTVLGPGQTSPATITVPVRIAVDTTAATVNNAVLVSGGGEPPQHAPSNEEKAALENGGNVSILPVCEASVIHNACRLPSEVLQAWPNVVVSKATDIPVFTVGEKAHYLIRVRNIGERATDAEYVVSEHLPPGVVLAGPPVGDGWACTGTFGDRRFQCASERVLTVDSIHPGTIKVPVDILPAALEQGTVNNAVAVAGGGENPERRPTNEQWKQFEDHPDQLELCDANISQNLCRVPNEVQEAPQDAVLVISKRGDRAMAEIGDMVQYSIEIRHVSGTPPRSLNILDLLPRGFTYIEGTARVDGRVIAEPLGRPGPQLGFDVGPIRAGGQLLLTYRVRIGVGALQGDGINRAQAHGCSMAGGCIDPVGLSPLPGSVPSNRTEYRVRVTGGVFTDEACVLGKIFVDCNNNHVQDREELGIPGVRLYFSDGTWLISDSEGKYSYCGLPPRSYTLKVDPSTVPVGSRLTTSSNRNLGDADSLFLDLKNGELHRADFIEGSCSNPVLEQVKARRTQGEVRAPETENGKASLRFESKPLRAPQQATDSANQRPIVEPRSNPPSAGTAQEVQP